MSLVFIVLYNNQAVFLNQLSKKGINHANVFFLILFYLSELKLIVRDRASVAAWLAAWTIINWLSGVVVFLVARVGCDGNQIVDTRFGAAAFCDGGGARRRRRGCRRCQYISWRLNGQVIVAETYLKGRAWAEYQNFRSSRAICERCSPCFSCIQPSSWLLGAQWSLLYNATSSEY